MLDSQLTAATHINRLSQSCPTIITEKCHLVNNYFVFFCMILLYRQVRALPAAIQLLGDPFITFASGFIRRRLVIVPVRNRADIGRYNGQFSQKNRTVCGPDHFLLEVTGVQLGSIALIGLPGEPFTDIGVQIKNTPGWDMIMPCCIVNGYDGYFPTKAAFDEGGYEARASSFHSNVAQLLVEGAKELLDALAKN